MLFPCISGCAKNKSLIRDKSDTEIAEKAAKFLEEAEEKEEKGEKEEKPQSHPIALIDEEAQEQKKKSSFWNRLFLTPEDAPGSDEDDFDGIETESLLAEAEKAEKIQDYDKAERLYLRFISNKSRSDSKEDRAKAYGKYGTLLARKGEYEGSEAMHLRSLELNPNDQEVAGAYAQALWEQKRYSESAAVARDVINRHGEDPRICYFLGESLLTMQRYQEGFRYLKKVIGEPEARFRMAQAYYSNGNLDAARFAMQKHDQYYLSKGLTPPVRSPMEIASSSQHHEMPTVIFPLQAQPIQAVQSMFPPARIIQPPMQSSMNRSPMPSQEILPQSPYPGSVSTILPRSIHASSHETPNENPLSSLQQQRKQSLLLPQTRTQHATVKVASPLTLSQKVDVNKESKIE